MLNNPFFSIIIPTYNRERFIGSAIESVQKQSTENWELIIVDDGSTDNTKHIISSYIKKDKRIKYLYQKNAERSAARNNGIKNSIGKYICFLDSDDEYKNNHLSTFFQKIQEIGEIECMIFNQIVPEHLKVQSYNNYEKTLKYMIHPQEVCIHKNIFKTENFDENLSIVEDFDLWIRIVDKFPLYNINKCTVKIHKHDDRSVNIEKKNVYEGNKHAFKKIYSNERFKNKISKAVKNETLADCYFAIYKHFMLKKDFKKARLNLLQSIVTCPSRQLKHKLLLLLGQTNFTNKS